MTEQLIALFLKLETNLQHCEQEDLRVELYENVADIKAVLSATE